MILRDYGAKTIAIRLAMKPGAIGGRSESSATVSTPEEREPAAAQMHHPYGVRHRRKCPIPDAPTNSPSCASRPSEIRFVRPWHFGVLSRVPLGVFGTNLFHPGCG